MITAGSLNDPSSFLPTKILFSEESSHWDKPVLPETDGASK